MSAIQECANALDLLNQIVTALQAAIKQRDDLGSKLFVLTGGDWQGPEATRYHAQLGTLLGDETALVQRVQNLITGVKNVQGRISAVTPSVSGGV